MSIPEIVEEQKRLALAIMADKSERAADKRADALVVSMRHLLACWVMVEASEAQLLEIVDRYRYKTSGCN